MLQTRDAIWECCIKWYKHTHAITNHAKQKKKIPRGEGAYSTSWNSVPAPPAQRKMGGELYLFCGWSMLE